MAAESEDPAEETAISPAELPEENPQPDVMEEPAEADVREPEGEEIPADAPSLPAEEEAVGEEPAGEEPAEEEPAGEEPAGEEAVVPPLREDAREGDVSEKTDIAITEFSIVHSSGETYTSITAGSSYKLKLTWDASAYGNTLQAGDYFYVDLPEEFKFPTNHSATHFNITTPDGAVIAAAVVDSNGDAGGGRVKVTFTDYVEDRFNVKGTMLMNFTVIKSKVTTGQINTFIIQVGSNYEGFDVYVAEPGPGTPVDPDEVLHKRTSKSGSTDEYVQWTVRINFAAQTLPNAVIEDHLTVTSGEGISQYIPGSFTLEERVFDEYGNKIETVNTWNAAQLGDRLQFSEDYTRFTLNLENIDGQQFYLKYRTTYSPGLSLKNEMSLTSNQDCWTDEETFEEASSGGSGSGDLDGTLRIIKVDRANQEIRLAGATFRITHMADGTSFELTTDASGEASSGNLLPGEYRIEEVSAPSGYLPNGEVYIRTLEEGGVITLVVEDDPETVDIPVAKQWVGPAADSVIVNLLADGQIIAEAELTAADGWQHVFASLPKYDPLDGHEIEYDVQELPTAGYTPTRSGTAGTGFTFTNTITGRTSVSVTKVWAGPAADSVTIELLADGRVVDSVRLSAENGWQHTFPDLERYAQGREILYTVQETPLRGYASTITGNMNDGFTVKNVSLATRDISVEKKWVGTPRSSIIVHLFADGKETASAVIDQRSSWTFIFRGLARYDPEDGHEIAYTISEGALSNYTSAISGSADSGFIITNTEKPSASSGSPPKTGDNSHCWPYLLMMVLSGSGIVYLLCTERRKKRAK